MKKRFNEFFASKTGGEFAWGSSFGSILSEFLDEEDIKQMGSVEGAEKIDFDQMKKSSMRYGLYEEKPYTPSRLDFFAAVYASGDRTPRAAFEYAKQLIKLIDENEG